MRLLLFDIDGTLTNTNAVDAACFVRAICDVFAIPSVTTDWSTYPDATDSAITDHLVRKHLGRAPRDEEVARMKGRFYSLLIRSFSDDPSNCQAIVGGPQFLGRVIARGDCAVALATGGWEITARSKLHAAGYSIADVPMASADEAHRRVDICAIAVERSISHYAATAFDTITYFGDGVWDAHAANALGFEFIGIGNDYSGAALVIPDFAGSDLHHLLGTD